MVFGVVLSYTVEQSLPFTINPILFKRNSRRKKNSRIEAGHKIEKKHPFCVYFLSFIYSSEVPVFCLWREQAGRERLSKSVLQTWLAQQQIQTSSWGWSVNYFEIGNTYYFLEYAMLDCIHIPISPDISSWNVDPWTPVKNRLKSSLFTLEVKISMEAPKYSFFLEFAYIYWCKFLYFP